ncbi:MAG: prolipoprotein diacylglyceryl transferase [Eubacteriales bacterium]|nr:prolipoprotein diacylglyceryl transferase [Eubacteriales bacterium]
MSAASILFPHLGITLKNVGQYISIVHFEIAYYGIIIALGMLCGVSLILFRAKRSGQDEDAYFNMTILTIMIAVCGARAYYVLFSWETYRTNLLEIFNLRGGGLAIYGGVIAGGLTVFFYAKRKKLSFPLLADTVIPGVIVGQILGRWGNFFNREAFGGYTDGLLAMALPENAVRYAEITEEMHQHASVIDGITFVQVHPTFLYESLWNVLLLCLLLWYERKKKFEGELFLLYLAGYGIGRFWIESLRTDQLLLPGIQFPVSQMLSGILAVTAVGMMLFKRIKMQND